MLAHACGIRYYLNRFTEKKNVQMGWEKLADGERQAVNG